MMENVKFIAPFFKRMNAHAIDLCITTFGIFLAVSFAATFFSGLVEKIFIIAVAYILIFLIPTLKQGQTIGKMIFKIQPTKMNSETPLNWWQIHLREATKYLMFIYSFGIMHGVSFIMASERNDRRTVHDLIFNTHVIDLNPETVQTSRDSASEDYYYKNGGRSIR